MHPKLKIIQEKEQEFDDIAELAKKNHPLKSLKKLPNIPGITPDTKKNLKIKSFRYLIKHDHNNVFFKYFLTKPLKHILGLFKAYFKKTPYILDEDFYLFNVQNVQKFKKLIKSNNSIFIIGFSYCHKPFECPSGRFTDKCINDMNNPICQQCFIGKCAYLCKETKAKLLFIPTIHYIGEKIFEFVNKNKNKKVTFLITACELSLEMFKDFGNMLNLSGIGVRLDGRICNTMRAFELSEKGIKPNLTVVLDKTQKRILDIIKALHT